MGYRDNMKTLFKGEITGLEPEFPNDQSPTLTVTGYDRRHRLMGKRKSRTFLNMKDSEIANQIAGDWSLTPKIEDTRVSLDYVLQNNQSDFEFLQERARRIGYEMVVTDTSLHFRPRKSDGSAVLTLSRDVELLDFSARLTTMGQVEEVNVQGWNAKDKKEVVAKSRIGDERQMGGSASGPAATRRAFSGTGGTAVRHAGTQPSRGGSTRSRLVWRDGARLCRGISELVSATLSCARERWWKSKGWANASAAPIT